MHRRNGAVRLCPGLLQCNLECLSCRTRHCAVPARAHADRCFLLGGGLWHPDAAPTAAMRRSIDRHPERIKGVLMDTELRKTFLKGVSKDEKKVVKAFFASNSENALKTKPKVSRSCSFCCPFGALLYVDCSRAKVAVVLDLSRSDPRHASRGLGETRASPTWIARGFTVGQHLQDWSLVTSKDGTNQSQLNNADGGLYSKSLGRGQRCSGWGAQRPLTDCPSAGHASYLLCLGWSAAHIDQI